VVRCYALRTLAGLSAKEAIPFILPLLNDPQPEVRKDAIAVLKKFGYRMK
ncbi:MAG: HEAT repeat domain-containing protein, partial [Armatimonadota bacterium]